MGLPFGKATEEQRMMVADCQMRAKETPAAKYDQLKGMNVIKKKPFVLKFMPAKKKDDYKIVKSKNPDQGTYKH